MIRVMLLSCPGYSKMAKGDEEATGMPAGDSPLPNASSRRRVDANGRRNGHYHPPSTITQIEDPRIISDLLPDPDNVLWIDITNPNQHAYELLHDEFNFHPLALEDVATRHERPKLDEYPEYYFIVFYAALLQDEKLNMSELNMFLGSNYLVTVHNDPIPQLDESLKRWQHNANNIDPSVGVLVYSIIDSLVDRYLTILDTLVERVEGIEESIFGAANKTSANDELTDLFDLKKELLALRRVAGPERDLVNSLSRRDNPILPPRTIIYFQDIYDHLVRVTESLDTYRDLLTSALDAQLSITSNRLNQIMKTLTVVTTIVMGMTLVPSVYGMNFDDMPELHWPAPFGYPSALLLMVGIGVTIYFAFRKRGWIGRR